MEAFLIAWQQCARQIINLVLFFWQHSTFLQPYSCSSLSLYELGAGYAKVRF